jgi:hypothetical protein
MHLPRGPQGDDHLLQSEYSGAGAGRPGDDRLDGGVAVCGRAHQNDSGTISIAPHGHSETQTPQPLQ